MATDVQKNFEEALLALVDESPSEALSVITGCFVSLTLGLLRSRGHEPDGDIKIDGGENRDITIHAPKTPSDPVEPERAYLRTVAELQELARNAPHVTQDWVLTVASMDPDDMRRRLIRSHDWHGHFAHALDGIPEVRNMPGAAPDGCWSHKEVRAVVLGLLRQIERPQAVPNAQATGSA